MTLPPLPFPSPTLYVLHGCTSSFYRYLLNCVRRSKRCVCLPLITRQTLRVHAAMEQLRPRTAIHPAQAGAASAPSSSLLMLMTMLLLLSPPTCCCLWLSFCSHSGAHARVRSIAACGFVAREKTRLGNNAATTLHAATATRPSIATQVYHRNTSLPLQHKFTIATQVFTRSRLDL